MVQSIVEQSVDNHVGFRRAVELKHHDLTLGVDSIDENRQCAICHELLDLGLMEPGQWF